MKLSNGLWLLIGLGLIAAEVGLLATHQLRAAEALGAVAGVVIVFSVFAFRGRAKRNS